MGRLNNGLRMRINYYNRHKLHCRMISLFSSNCNGACILHDLGLPFQSPFVNLWISAPDFVRFLEAPKEYLTCDLEFVPSDKPYPVARLKDIFVYFEHYESEAEAREQWQRRCARINWEKIFVLMTDRDGCNEDVLKEFDALPYDNKVVFTHIPRPDIASAVYIPGFEDDDQVGVCSEFINSRSGKKYYDAFDYVKWFNEGK